VIDVTTNRLTAYFFCTTRPDNRSIVFTLQRAILFFFVPVASFTLWALFRHARHRCPYRDPLCCHNRPCIACYRELFNSTES
jgi:hypothetical protein